MDIAVDAVHLENGVTLHVKRDSVFFRTSKMIEAKALHSDEESFAIPTDRIVYVHRYTHRVSAA